MKVYYEKIVSTPYKLFGAWESDSFSLKQIFFQNTSVLSDSIKDDRFSRYYIAICLTIENQSECEDPTGIRFHKRPIVTADFKNYSINVLNVFRNFLSLHFGKVFFDHGVIRCNEDICLPQINYYQPLKNVRHYCCNGRPRAHFDFGNNLREVGERLNRLLPLLERDDKKVGSFLRAMELYYNALEYYNLNETVSFILFVSAIETLIECFLESNIRLKLLDADEEVAGIYKLIDTEICSEEGKNKLKKFISDIYKVKQKFIKLILQYLDDDFYANPEDDGPFSTVNKQEMEKFLSKVYDIRCKFIHDGHDISHKVSKCYNFKNCLRAPIVQWVERISRYLLNRIYIELSRDSDKKYPA